MATLAQFAADSERPRLELSGPILNRALERLVEGTEQQGGIEHWIDALKLKSRMFERALGDGGESLTLDSFKALCTFMASVRRRVGPWLEEPGWTQMQQAVLSLIEQYSGPADVDKAISEFCARFPEDRAHRWVRDLATELLHNLDPERVPLMNRWVWDQKANTGVIREIWFDEHIDHLTLDVADQHETFLVLREELSQFLSANGVFRDMIWYIDLLCARIYADYVAAQGGIYLRADFSAPGDPMEHTRRLLGLDGVRAGSGRTRLKTVDGEAHILSEQDLRD